MSQEPTGAGGEIPWKIVIGLLAPQLDDPDSKLYLPRLILSSASPKLEPLEVGDLDLGEQMVNAGGLELTFSGQLKELLVTGLSNIKIPKEGVQVNGQEVTAEAHFSLLDPPPPGVPTPPLKISGEFVLSNRDAGTLDGTFSISVDHSNLHAVFDISGQLLSSLAVSFKELEVRAETGGNITGKFDFGSGGGFWAKVAETAFGETKIQRAILAKLNSGIAGYIPEIDAMATSALREYAGGILGGSQ